MDFQRPSTHPTIPTYRVMDSDGVIVDKDRQPIDVSHEEVLKWYKDMVTGTPTIRICIPLFSQSLLHPLLTSSQ